MALLKIEELLAQLQSFAASPPTEVTTNASLRAALGTAAKNVFLALEKPEDVVARILLSQVRPENLQTNCTFSL